MNNIMPLIRNETIKMVKKKRLYIIFIVLAILVPMFTYAQMKSAQNNRDKFGGDWRLELQQAITDNQNSLGSDRVPEEYKKYRTVYIQQMQYYLENDINPKEPGGVTFTREFMNNAVGLFIPLSKLVTLIMFVSIIVVSAYVICYGISGAVFGYKGFGMPVFTGFKVVGTDVDMSAVHAVSQWQYMLMQAGLIWFVSIIVAMLAFMVSVLVRSTAASIVIMMAALIAGTILTNMAASWESAKYLFMVNLELPDYLSGGLPPIEGMNLGFSLIVLSVWGAASLVVSFLVFTKRDILN